MKATQHFKPMTINNSFKDEATFLHSRSIAGNVTMVPSSSGWSSTMVDWILFGRRRGKKKRMKEETNDLVNCRQIDNVREEIVSYFEFLLAEEERS